MQAKIKYEKVMYKGGKAIKITDWEGMLHFEDLPTKYIQGGPHFYAGRLNNYQEYIQCEWLGKEKIPFIRIEDGSSHTLNTKGDAIYKGDIFTQENFQKLISELKKAGNRLTEINKEIKETQEKWNGEGEITI